MMFWMIFFLKIKLQIQLYEEKISIGYVITIYDDFRRPIKIRVELVRLQEFRDIGIHVTDQVTCGYNWYFNHVFFFSMTGMFLFDCLILLLFDSTEIPGIITSYDRKSLKRCYYDWIWSHCTCYKGRSSFLLMISKLSQIEIVILASFFNFEA